MKSTIIFKKKLSNEEQSQIDNYPDYLPSLIRLHFDVSQWRKNIKKLDNYHEIVGKMAATRHKNLPDEYYDKELESWIIDHPEYKNIIVED